MKRIFLIIASVLLETTVVHAQTDFADSLQLELNKNLPDTIKSDIALKLSKHYQEDNPERAIYYTLLGEAAALRSSDPLRVARALQQRGVSFDYANNLDSCLFFLKKSDSLYTNIQRFDRKAAAMSDIGLAYYLRGIYEIALQNFLKSLELMKQYGEKKEIAGVLNNIGLVYRSRKDYSNAIKYYQLSLSIKREVNDEQGILNTTLNIGSAFQRQFQSDSAYYYAMQSRIMAVKLNNRKDIFNSNVNIGAALASGDHTTEAKLILMAAEKEALQNNYKLPLPTIYGTLGLVYSKEKNFNLSLYYYKRALEEVKKTKSLESMALFFKEVAKTLHKRGDYKEAYAYLDTAKTLYDSLMNVENSKQINEMSMLYESVEKEKEIQKLNSNNLINATSLKARKRERNYFILSTLLFIGLTGIAYKAFTNNRKKKNQLNLQNQLIEKSLEEKEFLLREIHHRVKNNLQIVSSLLSLQSNYISDVKALDAVRESKNRVQSMAIIHQNLYQNESLVNINVKEYVEELVAFVFNSYNIHDRKIELQLNIQSMHLDVDTLIPIGLILNELINNCLKYAFVTGHGGKITVILQKENSVLKLSVYDDGIGLSGKESHFAQNSFGHKMIHAFLKKLKGSIKIYAENGTKVDIEITNFKTT